jgi:hypothetical protein
MATLDQWFEEIITEVPGATEAGAKQVLRRIFRKFCVDSGAYILEQEDPIDIVADQPDYNVINAYPTLVTSDDHIPIYIWSVGYFPDFTSSDAVRFLTPLQTPHYQALSRAPAHQPGGYKTDIRNLGVITLVPVVDRNITDALSVFVAFRLKDYPDFPDAAIPDVFHYNWFDIILDGTIGELCAQQDKSYTNATKATLHQKRFRNGIARARDEARNQFNTSQNEFVYPTQGGWVTRGRSSARYC